MTSTRPGFGLLGLRVLFLLVLPAALAMGGGLAFLSSKEVDAVADLAAAAELYETPEGPVQAVLRGEGEPVLVFHGAPGGYDQAILIAEVLGLEEETVVAFSRPGFLATPLADGFSGEREAGLAAGLLDAVSIGRVTVVGFSTGCVPAIWFAALHPQRTTSLVLLSPSLGTSGGAPSSSPARLAQHYLGNPLTGTLAVAAALFRPAELAADVLPLLTKTPANSLSHLAANPAQIDAFNAFFETLIPYPARRPGTLAAIEGTTLPESLEVAGKLFWIAGDADPFRESPPLLVQSNPQFREIRVAAGGHWPWLDSGWRETLRAFRSEWNHSDPH